MIIEDENGNEWDLRDFGSGSEPNLDDLIEPVSLIKVGVAWAAESPF